MPLRRMLVGVVAAVFGVAAVFALILMMNTAAQRAPENEETGTAINIEPRTAPPRQQQVQRKPPPRRRQQAPRPNVDLASALPGMDFGLPAFDEGDLGDLAGSLLDEGRDLVMSDDTVDEPPRPVAQTPIPYPARAKAAGVTGYVVLSLLIGPTGQIEKVKVLESQPSGVFDDAAVAGVQTWRFEPASYRGENVRVWARQRVRFDLG